MTPTYTAEAAPFVREQSHSAVASNMVRLKTNMKPDPTYYLGHRITSQLGKLIGELAPDRVYLVTNQVLFDLYGDDIFGSLEEVGLDCRSILIQDGEDHKSFQTLESLCETLVEQNISKASLILGLGGGCLTNIAGLAAALIFRGIRYVEMPTTLMGMTDSSLSNKQAVNGRRGKNHFGVYYAPTFLFGDTHYLISEPVNGKKSALVEGVKNGLISDPTLVSYFLDILKRPLDEYSEEELHRLTRSIIDSKLEILRRDPSEKAYAMTLEYGHTFGHAMEFLSKGKLPHGFAVAKGMCIAAEIGRRMGYISAADVELHYHLFGELLGLDLAIPESLTIDAMIHATQSDNKKTAGGTKFVLLERIGQCANPDGDFQVFVEPALVREVLSEYKANGGLFRA